MVAMKLLRRKTICIVTFEQDMRIFLLGILELDGSDVIYVKNRSALDQRLKHTEKHARIGGPNNNNLEVGVNNINPGGNGVNNNNAVENGLNGINNNVVGNGAINEQVIGANVNNNGVHGNARLLLISFIRQLMQST